MNKLPELLDLSHLADLSQLKLYIKQNSSHVIKTGGNNAGDDIPHLIGFNLQNIVLSDSGLDKLVIDARENQVVFREMLPMDQAKHDKHSLYQYFGWNVREYIVRAKVIH